MRIWERGAQSNSLGRAWEVSTRWCASWVGSAGQGLHSQGSYGRWGYRAAALWEWGASIQCSLRPYPAAAGLSWGARGEELLRNGAGLVRDRLFGERVGNGTLGGVLHLGGGLAAGVSGWGVR